MPCKRRTSDRADPLAAGSGARAARSGRVVRAGLASRGAWASVAALAALALGAAGAAGCVSIDGGTVEVAWTIFSADARGSVNDCSCADPAIAHIRLKLAPPLESPDQADPCDTDSSCVFSCGRKAGATHFTIPAASYLMSIEPLDADGNVIPADRVPAPILLAVTKGQHTDLGALEIVAPCAAACNGADILAPCSRP